MKRIRKLITEVSKPLLRRSPAMLRLLQLERDQTARMIESKDDDDILESSSSSSEDGGDGRRRKGARTAVTSRRFGQKRERRSLEAFLLEESGNFLMSAPKSRYPALKLCRVCLRSAVYRCAVCETRYCTIRCRDVHKESLCSQPLR